MMRKIMTPKTPCRLVRLWPTALILLQLFWATNTASAQSSHSLRSPDGRIEIQIRAGDRLSYSILLNGKPLLQDSTLSIKIDQQTLGLGAKVKAAKERSINQEITV